MQQTMQPRSSGNGYIRRRGEREGGMKMENKMQSGKLNLNRSSSTGAGIKIGVHESPSRDRLVYLTACLIGHLVEVQLKNGSVYSGTCYTTNIEKEFAIILKMARMTKDVPVRGQKAESLSRAPLKTLIIPGKDVVQLIAKDVSVTLDGMSSELRHEKQQEILIDSYISQSGHAEMERELEPWIPDEDDPQCPDLENVFDGHWNRGWDQFEANATLFGVTSTFDEELYTTKLERGPQMREREREAMRIAREIEGEETQDLHLAEERGVHLHDDIDIDEETRYSSVHRGVREDDSGYDDVEDILLDSCNSETFGDPPTSAKSTDFNHGKISDEASMLSSSSLDEAQCTQSSTSGDLYLSGSYDHTGQLASELPSNSYSTANNEIRMQENLHVEHGRNNCCAELVEEKMLDGGAQLPKSDDSQSSLNVREDISDKGRAFPNTAVCARPSHVPLRSHGMKNSSSEVPDHAAPPKGVGETLSLNSRGRPGSSTSSSSDCIGATSAPSGSGLSPSSSMGSLSSEKSTLNPNAKEFKLNPNAKSFTPSLAPVRPPSPVSDGSFYFSTTVSNLPHMHMPIGPSFSGHQPVIFNPQVAPVQAPQAYFHPGGPPYGQQMLVGHPRQVLYMPSYQPEMAYKGREF
ncbi:hypothetical protein K2173_024502 [Erythroxylum novogranatense]|uniref:LsmAD domain-containing protein n=1 Tax=Erythroxylum novogranatense TaxID=1862640 RepID=A0AAV8SUL7_9ROSI|nr:hypothetical protein K2173_024502 [Erythroxylum novogranatense]